MTPMLKSLTCCSFLLIKSQAVHSHRGCCWFGEHVLCFTELTGGKTIFPVLKGSPGGWDPENGSFPLTCQLCQRVT